MFDFDLDIPQSAFDFLIEYSSPWVLKEPDKAKVLRRYRQEVEPHFIWHFTGEGKSGYIHDGVRRKYLSYESVRHENYPEDWAWRSYLVKSLANWQCVECDAYKGDTEKPVLEADHIIEHIDGVKRLLIPVLQSPCLQGRTI